jgi:RimJ/RimL family protein N-acetyltransferase
VSNEPIDKALGQQPTLETDRLVLRPFARTDAPAVQALAGVRAIADTTLHIPHPYPEGAAAVWIATHEAAWAAGTGVTYAMTERAGHALVGAIGLVIVPDHACAELGYWVGVSSWNRGYCTEAARALLELGFGALALHRIQSRHLTRNPASGRVMQKIGMRLEGTLRDAVRKWDRFEDLDVYAILAPDWSAA